MSKRSRDAMTDVGKIGARRAQGHGALERDDLGRVRRARERRAREELILRLLPLAYEVAGHYREGYRPYGELVRIAQLGLVRAAERYDSRTDPLVARYALKTIRAELDGYCEDAPESAAAERRARQGVAAEQLVARLLSRRVHVRELSAVLQIDAGTVADGLLAAAARGQVPLYAPGSHLGHGNSAAA
jgi:RNA polymerase sigma-B factor